MILSFIGLVIITALYIILVPLLLIAAVIELLWYVLRIIVFIISIPIYLVKKLFPTPKKPLDADELIKEWTEEQSRKSKKK